MKRKVFSLLALLLIATSLLAFPAMAAGSASETAVTPRYVDIALFTASCSVTSAGKAQCYSYVETADPNYSIALTMGLQRYVNGGWTTVKSWTSYGTGSVTMDKAYYVTGDYYYHTAATATIRDENGDFVEMETIYSQSYYYAD